MTAPSEWDAQTYHRVSNPQFTWGLRVLDRLAPSGTETVLDAGCGSGRLTAELVKRLPRGRVLALDGSRNMLDEARAHLAPFGDRVEFVLADLGALALSEVADVIFSTATFHWVLDHDQLFAGLYRALRPGGRLCAQCGASRNLRRLQDRAAALMALPEYAPFFAGWTERTYYADEASTIERLRRAGFTDVKVWREEAPTPFPDAAAFREFIGSVNLRHQMARLPDDAARARFLDELVRQAASDQPPYTLDYWRLNIEATKPRQA